MTDQLPKADFKKEEKRNSPKTKIRTKLDNFPINEDEYKSKVDFTVYFQLIGVPCWVSEQFHLKAWQQDIEGAMLTIADTFKGRKDWHILKEIREQLENAIERLTGKAYKSSKVADMPKSIPKKKRSSATDTDILAFQKKHDKIKRTASFIDAIREPHFTKEQAMAYISALR